ncbi:MAG: rod shape-determining protein [Patescibacteria group bacterium]|nr:rod shape-determining protein [Patescibacteria group bacterium]MDE2015824.1 rod shape-determining protein [Patescibacteria group bacterium]MDE2227199.1 rod shape-determining protein [Patescibacteria group bacterium]
MAGILDKFFSDIGIDLGTANSLVYLKNRGIVIDEPTVAAINNKTNKILAIGLEAKKMLGRTPGHINVIRPLVNGVISDFEMTQEYLRELLKKQRTNPLLSYRRAVIAIPNNLTEVERKSVEDAALSSGCSKVYLVESPTAAALGADLPVTEPSASLIVDIGGGTTDIAIISLGGTVVSKTLKIAGDKFNEDIIRFVRDEFRLAIGESTAELAKIEVGSAIPIDDRLEIAIRGRDITTGLPREVILKTNHVRAALAKSLKYITDSIREVVEATPPELVGDILNGGIYVCGGGAMLRGLDELISKEAGVSVKIVDSPLACVARGLGRIIDDFDGHRLFLANPPQPLSINL